MKDYMNMYKDEIVNSIYIMMLRSKRLLALYAESDDTKETYQTLLKDYKAMLCRDFKTVRYGMTRFSGHRAAIPDIVDLMACGKEDPVLVITPILNIKVHVKALCKKAGVNADVVTGIAECRDHAKGKKFSGVILSGQYFDPSFIEEVYDCLSWGAVRDDDFFFIHLGL